MIPLGDPCRMRRSILLPLLLAIPVLLSSPGPAAAARPAQVVVLETRSQGDLRAQDRARLGDAVWAALDRLGMRRVGDTDREAILSGEADLRTCMDRDECQERLGRLLEATHVIGVSVTRTAPTAFRMQVRLFDVDVGQDGARLDWNCTACSVEDVARKLDSLVDDAVQKDHERPRATLVVRSNPPNADVQIDGRKIGFTELEHHVFAGPHDLVVSRPELVPERTHIDVSGEQRLTLSLNLTPRTLPLVARPNPAVGPTTSQAPPPQPLQSEGRRARWMLGLGIPLLVAGAGVVGLGATSLALDGRCADARCTYNTGNIYRTGTVGIIELAVGAVAVAGGIALIATDAQKQRKARAKRDE